MRAGKLDRARDDARPRRRVPSPGCCPGCWPGCGVPTALRGMTSWTVTIHWLYCRRFLKTLMDAAELLAHHRRDARREGRRPARSGRGARTAEPNRTACRRSRPAASGSRSPPAGTAVAGPRLPPGRSVSLGRPAGAGVVVVMPGCVCSSSGEEQPEVAVRDRVLVLLAQELLAQQDIDVGRERVGVLALVQRDRARVLPGAEDELGFLLALDRLLPDRHRPSSRRSPMMAMPASSTAMAYPASGRARRSY